MKSLGNSVLLALSVVLLTALFPCKSVAQERKVMNRPYVDMRRWHYGFSFGMHFQDFSIADNGFVYNGDGTSECWYAEVPDYSPGFSVGVLGELRLHELVSLRVIPTMHFGDKTVVYHDMLSGREQKQIFKTTYLSVPLDVKLAAPRFNNFRPYVMTGISPLIDLTVKDGHEMLVKRFDCQLEIGMGMDLYFPYFKLIPELKFCFGLRNILETERADLTDASMLKFTESIGSVSSRMIVLTLYFE